jgi:hypothetical protein
MKKSIQDVPGVVFENGKLSLRAYSFRALDGIEQSLDNAPTAQIRPDIITYAKPALDHFERGNVIILGVLETADSLNVHTGTVVLVTDRKTDLPPLTIAIRSLNVAGKVIERVQALLPKRNKAA